MIRILIAVPSADGVIQFQDGARRQVRGEFRGARERVTALAFGQSGQLFTGTLDGTAVAWDSRVVKAP